MAGQKSVRLFLLGDNRDAKAKIEEIDLKADEMSAKHPELKIGIDTAAAAEKLAILRAEMRATAKDAKDTKLSAGSLGKALADLASGGISTGWKDMSLLQKAIAGLGIATGIGEPAVAGLTTIVGALSSGLVSAGIGLGVFGAVAKGVFSQVSGAVQSFNQAQNTTGKAAATAMKNYRAELAALPPSQQAVAKSMIGADQAWQNFVQHNTSGVARIMSQGIGLLPKIFAAMQPFLAPTEKALHGLVSELGKGLSSSGFKDWIDSFAKASGSNLTNIGHAIGNIVVGIGGILKAFLPMATTMTGGLANLTGKFREWGTTLSSHSGFKSLTSMARTDGPLLISTLKNLGGAVKNVISDMSGLSTFSNSNLLLTLVNPLSALIKLLSSHPDLVNLALWGYAAYSSLSKVTSLTKNIKNMWSTFTDGESLVSKLAIKLGLLSVATEGEEAAQVSLNLAFLASPITWIIVGIAAIVIAFVELWKHSAAFRNFWKGLWKDIKTIISDVWDWVKGHWPLLLGILTGPIGMAAEFIISHWHQITAGAERMFNDVIGFFRRIPGDILSALGDLGHLLWNAGSAIINGFLDGIKSAWHAVTSFVGGIGSWIAGHKGPIEYDRVLLVPHGQAIMDGLVTGMASRMPVLNSQLNTVTNTISAKLAKAIKAYDKNVFSSTVSGYDITQIQGVNNKPVTATDIKKQLGVDLADIRQFQSNLRKLAKEGLNRHLIRQLIAAGPVTGGPAAAALASASLGDIRAISNEEADIYSASRGLAFTAGRAAHGLINPYHHHHQGHGHHHRRNAPLEAEWVGGAGADQEFITWLKKNIRIRGGDPSVLGR